MNSKHNLLLLKTSDSTQTNVNDRYIDFIQSKKCPSINRIDQINLLRFEFINSDILNSKLTDPLLSNNFNSFKSLILTSRQTVESIEKALEPHFKEVNSNQTEIIEFEENIENHKDKLIVYCVGDATVNRFKNLVKNLKILNKYLDKHLIIRTCSQDKSTDSNKHKQNAKELAKLIINDFNSIKLENSNSHKFVYSFYPCSSIRKDDLSNELNKANVSFEELHAYRTTHSPEGLNELKLKLESNLSNREEDNLLVFFSPSGCEAVFGEQNISSLIRENSARFKFISIGPSTSSKLKEFVAIDFIIELAEPSPQALFEKISLFI